MNISFINVTNEQTRKLLSQAAWFYASKLMDESVYKQIHLDIHINKNFEDMGQCLHEDDFNQKYPRFFKIEIRDGEDDNHILHTLAHEMVHLKQYALGELDISMSIASMASVMLLGSKIEPKWKGKKFVLKPYEDDYYDLPWEIEAFGRQQSLYERFLNWKDDIGEKDYYLEKEENK